MSKKNEPICSFCGKGESEVYKLILGPNANICDECIDACDELIEEEGERLEDSNFGDINILSPKEIKDSYPDFKNIEHIPSKVLQIPEKTENQE